MTVAELVLVAWLSGFVLAAMAGFSMSLGRLSAEQRDRARAQELARTARVVLREELRASLPAQRVAGGGDSLELRAVRGGGAVCAVDGPDLLVRYRGTRRPDPEKDSLWVLGTTGLTAAGAVAATAPSDACGGAVRIRMAGESLPPPSGLVLVHETGSYHLSAGALRYRRGSAGRQPLTEALLRPASTLELRPDRLALVLRFRVDSLRAGARRPRRTPVTLLNPGPP